LEKLGLLQFVASFQNVLNHTNLGEPSGGGGGATGLVVNNTNGGKITGTHIFPAAGSPPHRPTRHPLEFLAGRVSGRSPGRRALSNRIYASLPIYWNRCVLAANHC
jgi:hypothetical protein